MTSESIYFCKVKKMYLLYWRHHCYFWRELWEL